MNKRQLVEDIATRIGLPHADVARVIDAFTQTVMRSVVRGDKIVLSGFGTFHRRHRGKRTARNVWADEPVDVPATNVPAFRPGKPFVDAVARRRVGRGAKSPVTRRRRA